MTPEELSMGMRGFTSTLFSPLNLAAASGRLAAVPYISRCLTSTNDRIGFGTC